MMRPEDELQQAHDLMVAVIRREIDLALSPGFVALLHVACDAICWALRHDHNESFAKNLQILRDRCELLGIRQVEINKETIQ